MNYTWLYADVVTVLMPFNILFSPLEMAISVRHALDACEDVTAQLPSDSRLSQTFVGCFVGGGVHAQDAQERFELWQRGDHSPCAADDVLCDAVKRSYLRLAPVLHMRGGADGCSASTGTCEPTDAPDLVIGADVTYFDDDFGPLLDALSALRGYTNIIAVQNRNGARRAPRRLRARCAPH